MTKQIYANEDTQVFVYELDIELIPQDAKELKHYLTQLLYYQPRIFPEPLVMYNNLKKSDLLEHYTNYKDTHPDDVSIIKKLWYSFQNYKYIPVGVSQNFEAIFYVPNRGVKNNWLELTKRGKYLLTPQLRAHVSFSTRIEVWYGITLDGEIKMFIQFSPKQVDVLDIKDNRDLGFKTALDCTTMMYEQGFEIDGFLDNAIEQLKLLKEKLK